MTVPEQPLSRPLRIAVVTQEDPFYIGHFFRRFLSLLESGSDIVDLRGVIVQPSLGSGSTRELAARVWSLYGSAGFVRMAVRYALARLRSTGIARQCRRAGIPVLAFPAEFSVDSRSGEERRDRPARVNNINGRSAAAWISGEDLDLLVSVSASQIFGPRTLALPRYGCINLHNAPLPHYRGMLPNFWQMFHGEGESVLTVHTMVPRLDDGEILMRHATPIRPGTSLEQLMTETKAASAEALMTVLQRIHDATIHPEPMRGDGSYFTWPQRAEAREFRRRGYRVW